MKYLTDAMMDSPHPLRTESRPLTYLRKDIPRSVLDGRLHKKIGKNLMNRNRHRATTTVLLRLLRNLLNDGADNIHLRPGKFTAVPKSHSGVHGDTEEGPELRALPRSHIDKPRQLLDRQLAPRMGIVRPQRKAVPRVLLGRRLLHDCTVNLPQDAKPVIVGGGRMILAEGIEVVFGMVAS